MKSLIMIHKLERGWWLARIGGTSDPVFVHDDCRERHAFEVAALPEAPLVLTAVKRWLDIAEREWRTPGSEANYRAADKAKFALQLSIIRLDKWQPTTLETGVTG